MTTTITEAIQQVRESGKRAASHEHHTEIIEAVCAIGSHVRQGDIVLTMVGPSTEAGALITERQLAPGNTQGSRHVAEGDVDIYARAGDALTGPLLRVGEGKCRITHPEHRHYTLPPNTAWAVTYERDLEAEHIARVAD